MKEGTVIFAVIFSILLTIVTLVYINVHSNNTKAQSGLQECVVTSATGNTHVVWQKECK